MTDTILTAAASQLAFRPADQRYETLDNLLTALKDRRDRSRTNTTDLDSLRFGSDDDGNFAVFDKNNALIAELPTNWSFGQQLCPALGISAKDQKTLIQHGFLDQAVQNMSIFQSFAKNTSHKVMTVANGAKSMLQALTSPTYGRIWDADVVSAIKDIVELTGGRFYNPKAVVSGEERPAGLYASDRDCFVFMIDGGSVLDIAPRAQLNRGFFAWNSEVGSRKFGLATFLFNTVCRNHLVWGAQDVNKVLIKHTAGGPQRFAAEIIPALTAFMNASEQPVSDVVRRAMNYFLPVEDKDLKAWFVEKGFTATEADSAIIFAKSEEGDCRTLWQAIQGVTAYARGIEFTDKRVELETKAGNLMKLVE